MIWEVKMPRLDEDMEEGTISRWLKNEGDVVKKGEPLVEIETEKVTYEIEAPASGVLKLILTQNEQVVSINEVIAVVADAADDLSSYLHPSIRQLEGAPPSRDLAAPEPSMSSSVSSTESKARSSPFAKKLAAEKGIDISEIQGTGPGGRITKEDVLNFESPKTHRTASETIKRVQQTIPLSGVRKTIGNRLLESWRSSPRAEHYMSVDVTDLLWIFKENRERWQETYGVRPSVNDVIITAAAIGLRTNPIVNSSLQGEAIEIYEDINISIAVSYEKGVITPVLRNAANLDLLAVARESRRLVELVRNGNHSGEDISESTFTITNLGMFDVEFFVPIINPPESAILAVGSIAKKPVVINDAIAIRSMMKLCFAYDHRVLDGASAARFLQSVKRALENPATLMPGLID